METFRFILVAFLYAGLWYWLGYTIQRTHWKNQVEERDRRIWELEHPAPVESIRFRQRTAEADTNRQTKVRRVRFRAKKTITPGPRK
jgi:hypothetical protein